MNQAVEHDRSRARRAAHPGRPEWVALARLAAATVANRLRFSIEEIEDVKLAVAEACTAVIQHESHGEFIRTDLRGARRIRCASACATPAATGVHAAERQR